MHAGRRRFLVGFVVAFAGAAAGRAAIAAPEPAAGGPAVSVPTADDWRSVLETLFPHGRLDRELYAVPAGALVGAADKDPAARALLADGWTRLNAAAGGAWHAADAAQRSAAVASIVGTPLFVMLRQTAVFTFYNDPRVWAAFGYDGDAWRFGGWLGRGVNTIDWLPDPPAARG
jgi:hypothetical protein